MIARSRAISPSYGVRRRPVAICTILLFGLASGFGAPDGLARDVDSGQVTAYLRGVPITVYTLSAKGVL